MAIDEGPSDDDLDRLGGDSGYCPSCGAEIWDDTPVCPKCRLPVAGGTLRRPPSHQWIQARWIAVVALIVLLAFLALMLRLF